MIFQCSHSSLLFAKEKFVNELNFVEEKVKLATSQLMTQDSVARVSTRTIKPVNVNTFIERLRNQFYFSMEFDRPHSISMKIGEK